MAASQSADTAFSHSLLSRPSGDSPEHTSRKGNQRNRGRRCISRERLCEGRGEKRRWSLVVVRGEAPESRRCGAGRQRQRGSTQ